MMFITFVGLFIIAAGVKISRMIKETKQNKKDEDYYL